MHTSNASVRGEVPRFLMEQFLQLWPTCMCSVVEFRTREDMERAIRKLDGTELNGRKISLIEVCKYIMVNEFNVLIHRTLLDTGGIYNSLIIWNYCVILYLII